MTILVVEDDSDIRASLVELLTEEGYDARGFVHGAEALDYLRAGGNASLILLDLSMPVMDGFEFRRELRKDAVLAAIPVVLMTASSDARDAAHSLGVAGFLTKPLRIQDLLKLVERLRGG